MKICPVCSQTYGDETLNYCLNDGSVLTYMTGADTVMISQAPSTQPNQPAGTQGNPYAIPHHQAFAPPGRKSRTWLWIAAILGGLVLLGGGLVGVGALYFFQTNRHDTNTYKVNRDIEEKPVTSEEPFIPEDILTPESTADITAEKYARIKTGMSYKQVVEIIGSEGTELSESDIGNYKTAVYTWQGEDFEFVSIVFQNDKLLSKSKTGF